MMTMRLLNTGSSGSQQLYSQPPYPTVQLSGGSDCTHAPKATPSRCLLAGDPTLNRMRVSAPTQEVCRTHWEQGSSRVAICYGDFWKYSTLHAITFCQLFRLNCGRGGHTPRTASQPLEFGPPLTKPDWVKQA